MELIGFFKPPWAWTGYVLKDRANGAIFIKAGPYHFQLEFGVPGDAAASDVNSDFRPRCVRISAPRAPIQAGDHEIVFAPQEELGMEAFGYPKEADARPCASCSIVGTVSPLTSPVVSP